jgi:hypothetical protein
MSLLGVTTNQERPDLQVVRISGLLGVASDLDEVVHLGPADTELTQQVGEGIARAALSSVGSSVSSVRPSTIGMLANQPTDREPHPHSASQPRSFGR